MIQPPQQTHLIMSDLGQDGETDVYLGGFLISKGVAMQCGTIVNAKDICNGVAHFEVPGADDDFYRLLIEVLEHWHQHPGERSLLEAPGNQGPSVLLSPWDVNFLEGLSQSRLFELIAAADFLSIPHLLDITCYFVARMIWTTPTTTPAKIREMFNIPPDLTEKDEEEIAITNTQWSCREF